MRECRILLMDDEEIVRDVARKMLERMGQKVDVVTRGEEAFKAYKCKLDTGNPYDLVILDLRVIRGMGGLETMQSILEIDQNVCAVLTSGSLNDPALQNYELHGFMGTMEKPFNMDCLLYTSPSPRDH